jgi:SnoaL-like domain
VRDGDLARWIDLYERAWRAPGTALLDELFAEAATYRPAPFEEPVRGRAAIATLWEAERDGPDEVFELRWQPVAIQGDVGVARVEVRYAGPPAAVYRDVWIVTLDHEGRCAAFEEWPFFPGQPLSAR